MKSFYKSKQYNAENVHDCRQECKKDNADVVFFDTDTETDKDTHYCHCLTQVHKHDKHDTVLEDISDKKYKVNKVAFWVTFSFFLLFMVVLLYFFIQIFFIKKN